MNDSRLLLDAASFAAHAHWGQICNNGRTPYIGHPYRDLPGLGPGGTRFD
jgi:hypothetical protein